VQLSTIFLFLCVPFYFLLNEYIDQKTKLFIVPVILFYLPASFIIEKLSSYSGTESFLTTYLLEIINCIAILILFSLIKIGNNLNNVDKAFLYFWLYFTLTSFLFGNSWVSGITKLIVLIIFLSGLNCGKFIVQNRLEQKAFNFLSLSGLLCAYLYWKMLLPDMQTGLYQQLGFAGNEIFNPNVAALLCLPFIVSSLFTTFIFPNKLAFKIIGLSSLISNFYLLFMTGSRNAFYAAIICVIVFIAYKNRINLKKTLLLPILIAILCASAYYLSSFTDNRILQLFIDPEADKFTGRGQIWGYYLNKMDAINYIFGSGGAMDPGTNRWSNMHSMYIQIFYESGIIGSILFLLFIGKFFFLSSKIGKYAIIALCIFATVLASGIAESYPIRGFSIINFMWGISVGLLSTESCDLATNGVIETEQLFWSDQGFLEARDQT